MRLHGISTVGETASGAFSLTIKLGRAARRRLQIEAGGADLLEAPGDACERVAARYEKHDRGRAPAAWRAYVRGLDTIDPACRS